jgi:hypothetical protein
MIAGQEGSRHFAMFVADERGLVELQSLKPGLPLTLSVEDELGFSVHEEQVAPLRAQEERELTIRLTREPSVLEGRVEDALGQPLERAQVTLQGEGDGAVRSTGADGRFRFTGLHATQAHLRIELRGYVSVSMSDLPLPTSPLRIVLDPGREVAVRVLDASGAQIGAGTLAAVAPDGRKWYAGEAAAGSRVFRDLPARELEVRLRLAGTEYVAALGAFVEELELRVPVLGRLEVVCSAPELPEERIGLYLRSLDDPAVELWLPLRRESTDPTLFEAVLPGAYELSFSTWRTEGGATKIVSLATPQRVQIEAGVTTRTRL